MHLAPRIAGLAVQCFDIERVLWKFFFFRSKVTSTKYFFFSCFFFLVILNQMPFYGAVGKLRSECKRPASLRAA